MTLSAIIGHVFAGGIGALPREGQPSGIYKRLIVTPVVIGPEGLEGDQQADRRVHGGTEKAVHHYPVEHYAVLAAQFPETAAALHPGAMGENFSTSGLTERNVHIGDVFAAGSALLQVSQPRTPCWKINHRFDEDAMARFFLHARITGWYYRVLAPGLVRPGDRISLVERHTDRFSIDSFWRLQHAETPSVAEMEALAAVPGLAPDWVRRLGERAAWLKR
ncbi:MOSC domain-containing protein [Acidomonas methanolica]|uniref:Molybdenum cofactor sulphurase n=1 Tax=Acidomonas methanolica NBRC 104435 TaxID=1231351 RepID=A0A023D1S7_ACIMT|nr:MOSC domain-containing protein [Acidomonas methanolica]MBU2654548.1 MOSC domain-containing protein [Acidomonas methanolica]TCS27421.1 MOSC domain-containing protein YiiM [Acidomonas methanolica]GAJ28097.1 molybdenum cofactor sulphurase [Acidomonas methanolica NBRC 104435]GBQ47290.1 hypothetical protein AA0498_0494 [Acidomonas methanolica]GEK98671.1 molybdenum cofactor sulfurase [Acidomonas methanolica NBRC 104435]